jgi:hypothetical protein
MRQHICWTTRRSASPLGRGPRSASRLTAPPLPRGRFGRGILSRRSSWLRTRRRQISGWRFGTGTRDLSRVGVVAAWEREAIAERTATALAHKRRNARAYGPVAFGYRREGDALLRDPREQAALVDAHRMDCEGASFREIGAMLTTRGVMPHRGKVWHASSVRAMLRSRIATEAAASL